ncbi:hypothetical protein GCM10011386_36330 [Parapedobacter defluvii]|uniref:Uncharacterized protein n=1 Tax=Parapedobacter defluvii TaxID=2045106 RepID=A0ABQ1MLK0_9SPHI|nr:hypothetical protein [Parapedobacter defluvii]GGC41021.1 hypothetical protein GCM10011386_36330 [Parapedobacter defluvii]
MTITFQKRHFVILGVIAVTCFFGYYFRGKLLDQFLNSPEKTVNNALNYLMYNKAESSGLFSTRYEYGVLKNYSYYRIDNWQLTSKSIGFQTYLVEVIEASLGRNVVFVVEKAGNGWTIIDSYNFVVINTVGDMNGKSDIEKYVLMSDIKENVKLEHWKYELLRGGIIQGWGTVVNNSKTAVDFIKFVMEYRDKSGNIVNTQETYAIGGDYLLPGQRRKFQWFTYNCYDCRKGSAYLKFE